MPQTSHQGRESAAGLPWLDDRLPAPAVRPAIHRAQSRGETPQARARSPGVLGLPDRYRLFFRPFEAEGQRLLLILWLGFPRKDGDRNDCYAVYAVFTRLVQRGELPDDWESLQRELAAG
jgi:hypothetical protein